VRARLAAGTIGQHRALGRLVVGAPSRHRHREAAGRRKREAVEREQLNSLLTSIWERSGGYEAWSQVAAQADDKAA
jgi:hypothetical protein